MIIGKFIMVVILSYLLGAIPFGLIVSRLMGRVDVREYGSGKTGGTNVMRTVGRKAGILVIALDLIKALIAVILARVIVGDGVLPLGGFYLHQIAQVTAALMAMVGHNWSIFIKFHGGRGVAAFFGGWLALSPPAALFGAEILFLVALQTRYMSMGSIIGAMSIWCLLVPLTVAYNFPPIYLVYGLVAVSLVLYRHRDNISRLHTGTERRLGEKGEKLSL